MSHVGVHKSSHLEKRRRLWYAVLDVPVAQREVLGKRRFVQSLGTDSLSVAKIRLLPVLHRWKILIEEAKSGVAGAAQFRHFLDKGLKDGIPEWELNEAAESLAIDMGDAAVVSLMAARGEIVILAAHLQPFLSEVPNARTRDTKERHIRLFLSAFNYSDEITTESLEDFVAERLAQLSSGTQTNYISSFKSFWKYLGKKRLVSRSLEFFTYVVPVKATSQTERKTREHFEPQDYQRILGSVNLKKKSGKQLYKIIQLGAYTGCRIEELCSIKVEDVSLSEGFFTIRHSKTTKGNRSIPIHPEITELFENLVATSVDGFLLSGLRSGRKGRRGNTLSQSFGVLKTSLGYSSSFVFHSFRKGVATQFESAGVQEFIAARILGHKITTMSYGVYSGGASVDALRPVMSLIKW